MSDSSDEEYSDTESYSECSQNFADCPFANPLYMCNCFIDINSPHEPDCWRYGYRSILHHLHHSAVEEGHNHNDCRICNPE